MYRSSPAAVLAGESAAKTVRGALMQFDSCNTNIAMKPSMVVFRFLNSERKVRGGKAKGAAGPQNLVCLSCPAAA